MRIFGDSRSGQLQRSRLALYEKGHVYQLRASVAALRTLSADEIESNPQSVNGTQ
jgi:hypothetical protein